MREGKTCFFFQTCKYPIMSDKNEKAGNDRPEAYPQPSVTDQQLKNQPEYIDQQPNDFHDKSISDLPSKESTDSKDANSAD